MSASDDTQPSRYGYYYRVSICDDPDCKQVHIFAFDGDGRKIGHLPVSIEAAETLRDQLDRAVKYRLGEPCGECGCTDCGHFREVIGYPS